MAGTVQGALGRFRDRPCTQGVSTGEGTGLTVPAGFLGLTSHSANMYYICYMVSALCEFNFTFM